MHAPTDLFVTYLYFLRYYSSNKIVPPLNISRPRLEAASKASKIKIEAAFEYKPHLTRKIIGNMYKSTQRHHIHLQSWPKIMAKTAKIGVVVNTTSNVQPI